MGLMLGAACLLGGCLPPGDAGQTESTAPPPDDPTAPATSPYTPPGTSDLPQANRYTQMVPPPPLAAYAAYLDGPPEDPAYVARLVERSQARESAVAGCMAGLGFHYSPNPTSADEATHFTMRIGVGLSDLAVPYLSSDRDVVIRDGYGVTSAVTEGHGGGGDDDPNQAYWATLSPAESEAYFSALWGDYRDPQGTMASSCAGQAQTRFPELTERGRRSMFQDEFWDLIYATWRWVEVDGGAAEDLTIDGFARDPRLVQPDTDWRSCMSKHGFAIEAEPGALAPTTAMALALRTRPDGTVGPENNDTFTNAIPPEEQDLLGTQPERQVALADFDCRVETDYMARVSEIRRSKDEEFIAGHQAELDRLVAAADSW